MKKLIKILTPVILLAVIFAVYAFSNNDRMEQAHDLARPCPYLDNYTKTESGYMYKNTAVGFSVQVPKGWYIPLTNDSDPRIYNCDKVEGGPSFGITSLYSGAYEDFREKLPTIKEKVYSNLVPGAVVIEISMENLDAGPWGYLYVILFEKEKKAFNLIVPGNIEDSVVLPTLKVI